jgi:NMD protein affecting ribosome stability and mRNA decay
MANTYCPRCGKLTKKGGYKAWQIIVSICFFPIGLIALEAQGKTTSCLNCGYTWQA